MLGHDALGRWALGQLPGAETGAAVAPGAILPLTLTLVAGAASGEGVLPPVVIGGFPRRRDAVAPGALLHLGVSLSSGRAQGVVVSVDATAAGARLRLAAVIAPGAATGDAIGYDNDLILLLAA
jgi:hypothetical protein